MKSSRFVFLFTILFSFIIVKAQSHCDTLSSFYKDASAVNKDDVICLSKNSNKEKSLFYTFGIWCSPCRAHLPNAIKLAKDYNLDFYVLLIEKENSEKTKNAIDYLKNIEKTIKVLILKDITYGTKAGSKYKKFLKEITPANFENIDDMSKYILVNKQGKIVMVTNWKDNRENNWKDDSEMIKKRILPVLN